jgi:hypothetical protein
VPQATADARFFFAVVGLYPSGEIFKIQNYHKYQISERTLCVFARTKNIRTQTCYLPIICQYFALIFFFEKCKFNTLGASTPVSIMSAERQFAGAQVTFIKTKRSYSKSCFVLNDYQ